MENKLQQGAVGEKKNNVIVFGLQEKKEENYLKSWI
jgi:hypothetical protein